MRIDAAVPPKAGRPPSKGRQICCHAHAVARSKTDPPRRLAAVYRRSSDTARTNRVNLRVLAASHWTANPDARSIGIQRRAWRGIGSAGCDVIAHIINRALQASSGACLSNARYREFGIQIEESGVKPSMRIEGYDPTTNRVVHFFDSQSAARAAGYRQAAISAAIKQAKAYRGLRWRKETGILRLPEFLAERYTTDGGKNVLFGELLDAFKAWLPRSLPQMSEGLLFDHVEYEMHSNDIRDATIIGWFRR